MIWKTLTAAALALVLAACASNPEGAAEPDPKRLAESWVGHPVSQLISSWGEPLKVRPGENGHHIYSWHAVRRYFQAPQCHRVGARGVGSCDAGLLLTFACDFVFDADPQGTITAANGRGDCLPLDSLETPTS